MKSEARPVCPPSAAPLSAPDLSPLSCVNFRPRNTSRTAVPACLSLPSVLQVPRAMSLLSPQRLVGQNRARGLCPSEKGVYAPAPSSPTHQSHPPHTQWPGLMWGRRRGPVGILFPVTGTHANLHPRCVLTREKTSSALWGILHRPPILLTCPASF